MKIAVRIVGVILILAIIVLVASIVVLNMTPTQLKFADKPFGGSDKMTFASIGLQNEKLISILKMANKIAKEIPEKEIISNKIDYIAEQLKSQNLLSGSSVMTQEGTVDYSKLHEGKVIYAENLLVKYDDTTIGYLINRFLQDPRAEIYQFAKDSELVVKELTVTSDVDKNTSMRVIMSFNSQKALSIAEAKGIPNFVGKKFPKTVYLTADFKLSADENGVLSAELEDFYINKNDPQAKVLQDAILRAIAIKMGGDVNNFKAEIGNKISAELSKLVGNLGKIGYAEVDSANNRIVAGTEVYGKSGFLNGGIAFITYTK